MFSSRRNSLILLSSGLAYDQILVLCSVLGYVLSTNWTSAMDFIKVFKKRTVEEGDVKTTREIRNVSKTKNKSRVGPRMSGCALLTQAGVNFLPRTPRGVGFLTYLFNISTPKFCSTCADFSIGLGVSEKYEFLGRIFTLTSRKSSPT